MSVFFRVLAKKGGNHNLFAAYLRTKPLEELLKRVERERRNAQLRILI
jgi:predicted CopG family antitoxin